MSRSVAETLAGVLRVAHGDAVKVSNTEMISFLFVSGCDRVESGHGRICGRFFDGSELSFDLSPDGAIVRSTRATPSETMARSAILHLSESIESDPDMCVRQYLSDISDREESRGSPSRPDPTRYVFSDGSAIVYSCGHYSEEVEAPFKW